MDTSSASASVSVGREQPIRLLVVEDNQADAGLIRAYLSERPAQFRVALHHVETMEDALEAVESRVFDIVLLDLSLPDSTGFETFGTLHERMSTVPIVILSGQEDEALARQLVQRGAQDSLSKDLMSGALLRRTLRHAIERKRIHEELRSMQMHLIQAEKMESVGRLAAGVAHEVRNPLARILVGVEFLTAVVESSDPEVGKMLARMERAVQQADKIVRGLLDFSSENRLGLEDSNLSQLIEGALVLVEHETRSRAIEVRKELCADLPLVKMDCGRMEQVFINVFLNALHAMDESPERTLTVRTYPATMEDAEIGEATRTAGHLRSGDRVVVAEVEDTGCGVSEQNFGKVFDPFFTTKPTGSGTGLGLTVVRKIIDLHQGQIEIKNRNVGGACIRIVLKACSQAAATPITPQVGAKP